ncbi:alanine--tRNA ligase [Solirubrobacter phytolaccae]|uniref:Alanine--tRNA ligase n=1 Tax=Solirubrobacter phytolaccae TaxID=1404360 RepID=A0A9X3N5U2_9ACTN|nr:alanine--tRNA ligase [Solirubrobacter phytolaccae]MDA0178809.1 alanine--tRNA ligase [Solirubrobacter phytolaccae]
MTSDEIRERFLSFFESRDHKRLPSGSLVPAEHDPSVLLTTAGMHPLKPYFQGREKPPHHRLTSCQKCFRTPDIDQIGLTTRHLTCFEMLGNFSIGDYFKADAARFAWELSLEGFGFNPDDIWVTVFEGDEELGLGPDQEAIDIWLEIGVPRERIVLCPRSENFWQAGPTGPCGPCSELYLDRGLDFGSEDDLPGGDNERFLEYWNLVFMQFEQNPVGTLTPLPAPSIDTGLGLNRMALIQQGVTSIFETDQFVPLIKVGEELSGKQYDGGDETVDRALRILADHTRGMSFLIADGVVPSNEDRGYVLRRLMRRAIVQGRRIGIEPGFLPKYAQVVRETMGKAYPELIEHADTVDMWLASEEESFNRTLEQGMKLLEDVIAKTKAAGEEGIGADEAFRLHDTFGFPFDLTLELAAERGVGVDAAGFERLMERQRENSRPEATDGVVDTREQLRVFASAAGAPSIFTGYETTEQATAVASVVREDGRVLAKLVESPFYATGGGQIHDGGIIECEDGNCSAKVVDVVRLGDDQALVLEPLTGELHDGERVWARVDRAARRATECNHTATHLLHAALRERLGGHVHQAGSYVGPDKLRFDFTHGAPLTAEDRAWVEDRVNAQILENNPVRALSTTLDEAKSLGAMALFNEKYGDVVRMVEVGDGGFSRELCGGTHVRSTAEIGLLKITQETSSSANVRRIEAITGPEAVELLRKHDRELTAAAVALRTSPDAVAEAAATAVAKRREAEKALEKGAGAADTSVGEVVEIAGVKAVFEIRDVPNPKALPDLADKLRGQLGDPSVVVLGAPGEGRASLLVSATPGAVAAGVKAGAIVKVAAAVVGGGGGGRDNMAQAGGKDPSKLPDALVAARAEIERALAGSGT